MLENRIKAGVVFKNNNKKIFYHGSLLIKIFGDLTLQRHFYFSQKNPQLSPDPVCVCVYIPPTQKGGRLPQLHWHMCKSCIRRRVYPYPC